MQVWISTHICCCCSIAAGVTQASVDQSLLVNIFTGKRQRYTQGKRMSQVVSIVVTSRFEEARKEFISQAKIPDSSEGGIFGSKSFSVSFDESAGEIAAQGRLPDEVVSAFVKIQEKYGGKLFYEGEALEEIDDPVVEEAGRREKLLIILGIVFFPVTMLYLLLRLVIWLPFKLWKITR